MKSKISSGCQVSSLAILIMLIIEYAIFFLMIPFTRVSLLFLLGYSFITYAITCNNHGRNIHLYYERELSLVLKCIVTDLIMGVFLYTYFTETNTENISIVSVFKCRWEFGYIIMLVLHIISILLL